MVQTILEVSPISIPHQQQHGAGVFPVALACRNPDATLESTERWIEGQAEDLCEQAERHGAVLFRDFPVRTAEDFDRFVGAFQLENFAYEDSLSNAVRVNRTPRVFTANEAPPSVAIFLHHEMAQTPIFPTKLFFFCEKPADEGGATPICRSDTLWERLVERCPEFAEDCRNKGLRYRNTMPSENDLNSGMGRSWQSTLRSETRAAAEERLAGLGYRWEWLADGCLRVETPVLRAVHEFSDGRTSFFNQLIAAFRGWKDSRNDPSRSITFGDGTPLDQGAVQVAIAVADELTFDVPWQLGDVVLVDNLVAMHGRRTFSGTRKVLASLVGARS